MENAIMENVIEEKEEMQTPEEVAAEEQEELIEMPFTLRNLKDSDLFPLLQIFKKIGIKEFKEAFTQVATGQKTLKEIGVLASFDMIDIFIGNIGKAENEIYALWSDISGIPVDEMKDMEFGTLPWMISETFKGAKNSSFFKVLAKLL